MTTKTPMHGTKLPLRTWLLAMYFLINSSKGVSSVFLAKWLGVNQKTAWKIGHAIRAMMAAHAASLGLLDGIVELDEKYLGGKPRFQRGVKHPRGKGTKKACVHVAVSRQGSVQASMIPGDSYAVLAPYVKQVVSPDARIMTDQLKPYVAIGKQFAGHERVHHGIKEFARGQAHVNTAESFNAILERAKQGVFHFVSSRHLPRYLSEVVFRWNNRDPVEKKRNGLSKIVMQAKPVLEQLGILLNRLSVPSSGEPFVAVSLHRSLCFVDRSEINRGRELKEFLLCRECLRQQARKAVVTVIGSHLCNVA